MADVVHEIDNTKDVKICGAVTWVAKTELTDPDTSENVTTQVHRRTEDLVPFQAAALESRYDTRFDDRTYYTT